MPVIVRNTLATVLDIPGAGLLFTPGEEKSLDAFTLEVSAAIRSSHLEVIAQQTSRLIVVENDGDSSFDLPFSWSGPHAMQVSLNGLLLSFDEDYTVDALTNRLLWLDEEISLSVGDVLQLIGGTP